MGEKGSARVPSGDHPPADAGRPALRPRNFEGGLSAPLVVAPDLCGERSSPRIGGRDLRDMLLSRAADERTAGCSGKRC